MKLGDLLERISTYEPQYKDLILRAYLFASEVHKGVKRKSGEPYITHPTAVACILAEMQADADTIAAGLLHDTIEDGENITKKLISEKFNPTIAYLVDGVSKMKSIDFDNDKRLTDEENTKKIIESIMLDIRILIIKLADRLHNMRTLEYHKLEKQIEISRETLDFFVPFATLIGEYAFKQELEDLSFKYLYPEEYAQVNYMIEEARKMCREGIDKVIISLTQILNDNQVPFDIKVKVKNVYGIYRRLQTYKTMDNIHDLFSIKYILNNEDTCYWLRDRIEENYTVLSDRSKDYIKHPKANLYRSLHTSIYYDNSKIIQVQMKTKEMYMINAYGIPAYWSLMALNHPERQMQNDVRHFPFYPILEKLVNSNLPAHEFNQEVKEDILTYKINVYHDDKMYSIPDGSSVVDLAYKVYGIDANNYQYASIDGEKVGKNYILTNGETVDIKLNPDNLIGPLENLEPYCHTEQAKRLILDARHRG